MMILRSAPPSPFARKVHIAVSLLGFEDDVKVEATDTMDPNDKIRIQNPLAKIPALVAEDGTVYFDSRVILEYLEADIQLPRGAVVELHIAVKIVGNAVAGFLDDGPAKFATTYCNG